MRLALCTRYDRLGASSRLRFYAYRDALEQAGFQTEIRPFFTAEYLRKLYRGEGKSRVMGAVSLLRRLAQAFFLPEKLYIEYELFPRLPYGAEEFFLRRRRYVLNFDDNVWEKYRDNPRLADKYDRLCANAAGIITANDFLTEKVSRLNGNVIKIPTAVDLDAFAETVPKREKFTLCWIGTPVTFHEYLAPFAPVLQLMAAELDFRLLVIGGKDLPKFSGVDMECVNWSEAEEAKLISSCHAGIMPLKDDDFARGKSAYKLLQFFAAGLPVIASPVGENVHVVTPECGFLPENAGEWVDALGELQKPDIYNQKSAAAKGQSREFSMQKYRPILAEFIANTLN